MQRAVTQSVAYIMTVLTPFISIYTNCVQVQHWSLCQNTFYILMISVFIQTNLKDMTTFFCLIFMPTNLKKSWPKILCNDEKFTINHKTTILERTVHGTLQFSKTVTKEKSLKISWRWIYCRFGHILRSFGDWFQRLAAE